VARDGIGATTVPPRDPAKLTEAINTLINDPERRRRMGEAAPRRAIAGYAMDIFHKGIETVYRLAIASARPAPTPQHATSLSAAENAIASSNPAACPSTSSSGNKKGL
jgi:hypothetical protein